MKITVTGSVIKEMRFYVEKIVNFKEQLSMHLTPSLFSFVSFEETEDIERCAIKITATISVLSEEERTRLIHLVDELASSTNILERQHKHTEIIRMIQDI